MTIQARTLRALIEASPFKAPPRKPAQQARYDRILGGAQLLMESVGRENITMANLALALDIAPTTLRRYIVDIDYLFAEILRPHLQNLANALAEIPNHDPDATKLRRAAYITHTRTPEGAHTPVHRLLLHQSHLLPPDLHDPIVQQYCAITGQLAEGNRMVETLTLLEDLSLTAEQVEARLTPTQKPRALTIRRR